MIADFYIALFILSGVLSTTMGSIIVLESVKIYRKARNSKNWDRTSGTISKAKITEKKIYTTSKNKIFEVQLEYQFSIGGTDYTGNQQNIGNHNTTFRTKTKAESQVNQFNMGQAVTVYYNSSKPEDSSLSIGPATHHLNEFLVGIIFIILGLLLLWIGIILLNH